MPDSKPKTANALVSALSDDVLRTMAREAIAWRREGVLTGEALRALSRRLVSELGLAPHDSLAIADSLVIGEAAARFVNLKDRL